MRRHKRRQEGCPSRHASPPLPAPHSSPARPPSPPLRGTKLTPLAASCTLQALSGTSSPQPQAPSCNPRPAPPRPPSPTRVRPQRKGAEAARLAHLVEHVQVGIPGSGGNLGGDLGNFGEFVLGLGARGCTGLEHPSGHGSAPCTRTGVAPQSLSSAHRLSPSPNGRSQHLVEPTFQVKPPHFRGTPPNAQARTCNRRNTRRPGCAWTPTRAAPACACWAAAPACSRRPPGQTPPPGPGRVGGRAGWFWLVVVDVGVGGSGPGQLLTERCKHRPALPRPAPPRPVLPPRPALSSRSAPARPGHTAPQPHATRPPSAGRCVAGGGRRGPQ